MELRTNYEIDLGKLIAIKRIELNITQENLANGICSIPYLSKVENNKIEANPEIINLLCSKLGIDFNDIQEKHIEYRNLLIDMYHAINLNEDIKASLYWEKIMELEKDILDSDLINSSYLLSFRYYLYIHDDVQAKHALEKLDKFSKVFTMRHCFYFNYFKGLYYSYNQNYAEGINYFIKARSIQIEQNIKDINLIYHISLTYSQIFNSPLAILYALEAIENFQNDLNMKRVIDCQIILGINYTRIGDYERALNHYDKILNVAIASNNRKIISKTYHNLGFMYSTQKKSDLAIEYYKKSLDYKEIDDVTYVNTIYFLALEYISNHESQMGLEWINKGIIISKNNKEKRIYYLKLTLLKYLELSDINSYIEFAEAECIPFFKEKNNNHDLTECYETLGDLYQKLGKYKYSSHYYKLAIETMKIGG